MRRTTWALAFGVLLAAGAARAESAWTGGDDLPTSPLACDATAAAAAAKPYDGGTPTGAPDRAGKPLTVVDIPKLIGIGYFNATSKGIADAAKELGNVTAKTDGPTKANIDEQITFIDNTITSGVDGTFSPITTLAFSLLRTRMRGLASRLVSPSVFLILTAVPRHSH